MERTKHDTVALRDTIGMKITMTYQTYFKGSREWGTSDFCVTMQVEANDSESIPCGQANHRIAL